MNKGIHRSVAGSKSARQMNLIAKSYPSTLTPEQIAWNKRVEQEKAEKQTRKKGRK